MKYNNKNKVDIPYVTRTLTAKTCSWQTEKATQRSMKIYKSGTNKRIKTTPKNKLLKHKSNGALGSHIIIWW